MEKIFKLCFGGIVVYLILVNQIPLAEMARDFILAMMHQRL